MFTITKHARIHESVVRDRFSTAEIASMNKGSGSTYYHFPFKCPIIGCGDEAPTDYDPAKKFTGKFDPIYTTDKLIEDVRRLVGTYGLEKVTDSLGNGLDLKLRSIARPTPKARMDDANKAEHVLGHYRDEALEILASAPEDLNKALVDWFNENVG